MDATGGIPRRNPKVAASLQAVVRVVFSAAISNDFPRPARSLERIAFRSNKRSTRREDPANRKMTAEYCVRYTPAGQASMFSGSGKSQP